MKIANDADVFILCSLGEAIAMSLLECMYMKKICIVSNTIGNKSVIKDGFNGFICNTPVEYADCIKRIKQCYPENIASKAFDDINNIYNTSEMKRKYIDFYNSIIK